MPYDVSTDHPTVPSFKNVAGKPDISSLEITPESWYFSIHIHPGRTSHNNWIMTTTAIAIVPCVAKTLAPCSKYASIGLCEEAFWSSWSFHFSRVTENAHIFVLYKMKSTHISWNNITIIDSYLLLKLSKWIYCPFANRIICIYVEKFSPFSNALK